MEEKTKLSYSMKSLIDILLKKWKISVGLLVFTLLISIFGTFWYSKNTSKYVSNVEVQWPGIELNQYPNGHSFNYKKIISLDNLEKVKNSDDLYKDIDVDSIFYNNAITINQNLIEKPDGTENNKYDYFYVLTIEQKYFNNYEQASSFVQKLIESETYDYAKNNILTYEVLDSFKFENEETEYPEMLNNIENQIHIQNKLLEDLIVKSSKDFVYDLNTNETLGDLLLEYNTFLQNFNYKSLEYQIIENNYVRNEKTYKENFTKKINAINLEIEVNNNKINALKNAFNGNYGDETVPQLLADLVLKNEDLKNQKKYYENCLATTCITSDEFESKIINYQNKLKDFNKKIELSYKEVNLPLTNITYSKNKIIESESLGIFKSGLIIILSVIVMELLLALLLIYKNNNFEGKKDTIK